MSLLLYPIRRRSQRVATEPVAFDDRRDFIADDLSDAGAIHPSLTSVAPRPSYVHRFRSEPFHLLASLPAAFDLQAFPQRRRKVVAAALSRAYARAYPQRLFAVGKPVQKFGATHQSAVASFAEFNRLRLDPRTATCVRRRARREVLFAKRVAGRRGLRTYRRNESSQWSCSP